MSTHKPDDPVLDAALLDRLLAAVPALPMPAARRSAAKARLLAGLDAAPATASAPPGFDVVTADTGDWRILRPGIALKALRVDPIGGTHTSLWRLDPGARLCAHPHTQEEECLVLDGSILWEGRRYGRGDFLRAHPGTAHPEMEAPEGVLLLIRGELNPVLQRLFA